MFPYTDDAPPAPAQENSHAAVAVFVSRDFRLPETSPGFGHSAVPAAAVPKATVNKNGDACVAKNEIGVAGKRLVPTPTCDAVRPEYGCQLQFGIFVTLRPNCGHDLAALLLGEHVGHAGSVTDRMDEVVTKIVFLAAWKTEFFIE